MSEAEVPWNRYDQAYRHIHEKLAEILEQLSNVKEPSKYLPVRLSDGSAFYTTEVGAGSGSSQIQVRNPSGIWTNVGYDTEDLSVPVHVENAVEVTDNADRLVGRIYGSQGQQLKQRTNSHELVIQLAHAGAEIDPRQTRTLTAIDTVTVDNQILRDSDEHGQVDVLTCANPPSLDVALSTRLRKEDLNLDVDKDMQVDVKTLPSLPPGVNEIGKVQVTDVAKTSTPWSTTATSTGDNAIKTPSSGKKLRIKLLDVWNNGSADITVYLRFATGTARFKKLLAAKTGFIMNFIGCNWEGAVDEILNINLSAAGTVDVTVLGDEV